MGLDLIMPPKPKRSPEPVELPDLAAEVLKLAAIAERMDRTLGSEATDERQASGVCGCVAELRATVGRAPNAATGEQGSGLCGVVADLATAHATQGRKMVAGAGLAAGGTIALIELVIRVLQAVAG